MNFNWSTPFSRQVGGVERWIRQAPVPIEFWDIWNRAPDQFKRQGIQPGAKGAKVYQVMPFSNPSTLLRDYQKASVRNLDWQFADWRAQIDASSMGTGKTFTAMGLCQLKGWKPFVVCRKPGVSEWKRVAGLFGVEAGVSNWEAVRRGGAGRGGEWVEVDMRDGRTKEIFQWEGYDILIFDEIHNARGLTTLQSQLVIDAWAQGLRMLGISATPGSSPLHFKALGLMLGLYEKGEHFYRFLFQHGCQKAKYGFEFNCGLSFGEILAPGGEARLKDLQREVMDRLHQFIFKDNRRGVRVNSENIPGFPDNTIIPVAIDFEQTNKIAAAYKSMEEELAVLRAVKSSDISPTMTRVLQEIELLKVPTLISEIQNGMDEGYSVIAFVNYRQTLEALAGKLKTKCIIAGGQDEDERNLSIDLFQSNQEKHLLAITQAGGETINLQDLDGRYPRLGLISPTFWAEPMLQAMGRYPREGAKSKCITRIPFAKGTYEEKVLEAVLAKRDRIETLIDSDLR